MKTITILAVTVLMSAMSFAADTKIVLIAGRASHGPGAHEHNAGMLLFQKCLNQIPGIKAEVYSGGFPKDLSVLDGAAAVAIYSDGGGGHPALQGDNLATLGKHMDKGVGLALIHYAVEPTKDKGEKEFLNWVGGCFEINWSVNPFWTANFKDLPKHPITRGVKPFSMNDEWYYHMRFADDMKGVTPILFDLPGPDTLKRKDGPHEGNPAVRKDVADGKPQTVAWAYERANGGRGFGFTGGHNHTGWAEENMRRVVLNALLWVAKVDVPENGVQVTLTEDDLKANLDVKGGPKPAKKK
jgi:type 1 glutamine amidotransferase